MRLLPRLLVRALKIMEVATLEVEVLVVQMYDVVADGVEPVPTVGQDDQRHCCSTASTGYCSRQSTVFQFAFRRLKLIRSTVTG